MNNILNSKLAALTTLSPEARSQIIRSSLNLPQDLTAVEIATVMQAYVNLLACETNVGGWNKSAVHCVCAIGWAVLFVVVVCVRGGVASGSTQGGEVRLGRVYSCTDGEQ